MGAIISLLIIAGVSLIIVRVGSIALMMTGLSWDVAHFQSYSAFFGVGFTTSETEMVVSTPQRRRIVKHLMLTGNLGLTAGLGSVIVAFVKADGLRAELGVLLWIVGGLALVGLIAATPPTRKAIDWLIRLSLKQSGVLHAADFSLLLRLHAGFTVSEVPVPISSSLAGRTLAEARLGSQGAVVLGIARRDPAGNDLYIGTPHGSTVILAGDLLTIYGKPEVVNQLVR